MEGKQTPNIGSMWDNSANLSELPTFPKLPFPHPQIKNKKKGCCKNKGNHVHSP